MFYLRKGFKGSRLMVITLSLLLLFSGCSMSNTSNETQEGTDANSSEETSGSGIGKDASIITVVKTNDKAADATTEDTDDSTTDTTTDEASKNTDKSKEDTDNSKEDKDNTNEDNDNDTAQTEEITGSVVYMTTDITPEGLIAIYEALGKKPAGNVAVKISTGEPGGNYYLSPDLIKDLVQEVDGTIVECNTAYGGGRINTKLHKQVAEDHGFTAIATVDIMDEDGSISIPIEGGTHLTEDKVGSHFTDYDFFIVLSHFKGHAMGGFGGAIKNTSIGIASSTGKGLIHSAGKRTSGKSVNQDDFLESMAEAAKGVSDSLENGENIIYINVMNNLSVDCDCDSTPSKPNMKDIGILASTDPVALDQACVDLVYAAPDGASLIKRMERQNGIHTLEHAEEIGLGSRTYTLVSIDE